MTTVEIIEDRGYPEWLIIRGPDVNGIYAEQLRPWMWIKEIRRNGALHIGIKREASERDMWIQDFMDDWGLELLPASAAKQRDAGQLELDL